MDQFLSKILDLLPEILPKILGFIENWGQSVMVAVKLSDIMSGLITFENILSMSIRMASYSDCWL